MQPARPLATWAVLTSPVRPSRDGFPLPARVRVTEAAVPGNDRHAAFFKSAELTVFGEVAEIAECTPRPFVGPCSARIGQLDDSKNSDQQNNASHKSTSLVFNDTASERRRRLSPLMHPSLVTHIGTGRRSDPSRVRVTESTITG